LLRPPSSAWPCLKVPCRCSPRFSTSVSLCRESAIAPSVHFPCQWRGLGESTQRTGRATRPPGGRTTEAWPRPCHRRSRPRPRPEARDRA
jgi:hypothetical protein